MGVWDWTKEAAGDAWDWTKEAGEDVLNVGKDVLNIGDGNESAEANRRAAADLKNRAGGSEKDISAGADRAILDLDPLKQTGAKATSEMTERGRTEDFADDDSTFNMLDTMGSNGMSIAGDRSASNSLQQFGSGKMEGASDSAINQGIGNAEDLYNQRRGGGLDPASQLAVDEGMRANARQMSAMGMGRSGATAEANTNLTAKALADQFKRQDALALGSDVSRQNRLMTGLTGAQKNEDILTDRAAQSDKYEQDRARLGVDLASDVIDTKADVLNTADESKRARWKQAVDSTAAYAKPISDMRYNSNLDAEREANALYVAGLGGDVAAGQAEADAESDLLNLGARLWGGM